MRDLFIAGKWYSSLQNPGTHTFPPPPAALHPTPTPVTLPSILTKLKLHVARAHEDTQTSSVVKHFPRKTCKWILQADDSVSVNLVKATSADILWGEAQICLEGLHTVEDHTDKQETKEANSYDLEILPVKIFFFFLCNFWRPASPGFGMDSPDNAGHCR